jgi:hypothetical protein
MFIARETLLLGAPFGGAKVNQIFYRSDSFRSSERRWFRCDVRFYKYLTPPE